ncbi:hypothetical protein J3Q64DRAFT_1696157 [Phycomyces blakesleeanus]|uniref:Uncharacterized protein n=1 Tax=Phycomyces blakesleeanus TaxID=4837 RepID=A0ABR3B906_PHYBL
MVLENIFVGVSWLTFIRDAWKNQESMAAIEAKYRYVDLLLRVASEAYKKSASRLEAQQIIQAFAMVRPSEDNDSDEDIYRNPEGMSIASEDIEEQAYLRDIQQAKAIKIEAQKSQDSRPTSNSPGVRSFQSSGSGSQQPPMRVSSLQEKASLQDKPNLQPSRTPSVASVRSNTSLTNQPRRRPSASNASGMHSPLIQRTPVRRPLRDPPHLGLPRLFQENFDDKTNPWAQQPSQQRYKVDHSSSEDSIDGQTSLRAEIASASMTSPMITGQRTRPSGESPIQGSSTTSSVTATPTSVARPFLTQRIPSRVQERSFDPRLSQDASFSMIALGPATKRALESLQAEIIALNERIDDLRQELVERNKESVVNRMSITKDSKGAVAEDNDEDDKEDDDEAWEGWRWVIKAAAKHAAVNLLTTLVLFVVLYRSGSPVAHAITGHMFRVWQRLKLQILFTKVVV